MSLTLKILSSFIGVVGVGGSILGVSLVKDGNKVDNAKNTVIEITEPTPDTKSVPDIPNKTTEEIEKTIIVAKLNGNIGDTFDPAKNKYVCQINHQVDQVWTKGEIDNECEVSPIIAVDNKNSLNLSSINTFDTLSNYTFDQISHVQFWTIKFDSKKWTDIKFDESNFINVLFDNDTLFNLKPCAEIKNNNFVQGKTDLLVVKSKDTENFSEFSHDWTNNTYFCVLDENETLDMNKNICTVSFFDEEMPTSKTTTPLTFKFKDLTMLLSDSDDENYESKIIKNNQYYVLKLKDINFGDMKPNTPVYYFQQNDTDFSKVKKTTFYPVMNLLGWIPQLLEDEKTEILVPDNLIS